MPESARLRILVLSMSPLQRDARVLRQIELLSEFGEVNTVGFGPPPANARAHLQVPDDLSSLPHTPAGVARLGLRRHRSSENSSPAARYVLMQPPVGPWDLVVANDARVLDLAAALADGAPIWADMHEWAPEEQATIWRWRHFVGPFMTHLCRTYLPTAALVTTVGPSIGELYERDFGIRPLIMVNSPRLQEIEPSRVEPGRIRLVHCGAALARRGLEELIDAAAELPDSYSFDLFLVPGPDPRFLEQLRVRASVSDRIQIREPVAPTELAQTLSQFDVGVYCLPPVGTNARLSFPNKLFDFIQARLAIVVGPGPEMARVVREYGLGAVTAGFTAADIRDTLLELDEAAITRFKQSTHAAAARLSFEAGSREVRNRLELLLA